METDSIWTAAALTAVAAVVFSMYWMLVWELPTWAPPPGVLRTALHKRLPAYEGLPRSVVVTGGLGFLGRHMVEALASAGVARVVVFDLKPREPTTAAWVAKLDAASPDSSVTLVEGNLVDEASVRSVLRGVEAVIHCASPSPQTASDAVLRAVLVDGSHLLCRLCEEAGVGALVLTSSASVVFSGVDQPGADEGTPIPATFRDVYSRCKAESERIVCDWPSKSGRRLRTAAVRPHGIFGPRDAQAIPGMAEVSSTWRGRLVLGDGANVVDFTYVGNVVHGHMLALQRLHAEAATGRPAGLDGSAVTGRAFFVTNDEPIPFWSFVGRVKASLGYPPALVRVPFRLVHAIATVQEAAAAAVARLRGTRPAPLHLSPQRVAIAGTAHWYRVDRARAALGFEPVWTMDEALALSARAFRHLRYSGPGAVRSPLEEADEAARPCDGPQLEYTAEEVAEHCSEDDAWLIVDGAVHDVTHFIPTHPGGPAALLRHAGRDASKGFHGDQHPDNVEETLADFRIGTIAR